MTLDGIDVFAEVVECQSFSRAARRLGMPTSTVSTRIARLEERLGVTLLTRSTRQVSVTPAGQAYYEHCRLALEAMAQAEAALGERAGEPTGALRLTAPADIAQTKLPPLIHRFLDRYPRVSIDLIVSNRTVDLIAENVDLAVRIGQLRESTLIARKFFEAYVGFWAAPAYLERHGIPHSPAELSRHQIIAMSLTPAALRALGLGEDRVRELSSGRLRVDDMQSCRAFVESGMGLGLLPDFIGQDPLRAPSLVPVLPELRTPWINAHFVYPAQRYVPAAVRAFIDLATQR